jgi:hypothetical protein
VDEESRTGATGRSRCWGGRAQLGDWGGGGLGPHFLKPRVWMQALSLKHAARQGHLCSRTCTGPWVASCLRPCTVAHNMHGLSAPQIRAHKNQFLIPPFCLERAVAIAVCPQPLFQLFTPGKGSTCTAAVADVPKPDCTRHPAWHRSRTCFAAVPFCMSQHQC